MTACVRGQVPKLVAAVQHVRGNLLEVDVRNDVGEVPLNDG